MMKMPVQSHRPQSNFLHSVSHVFASEFWLYVLLQRHLDLPEEWQGDKRNHNVGPNLVSFILMLPQQTVVLTKRL